MNSSRVVWRQAEADAVKEAESLRSRFPHDIYSVRSFGRAGRTCWEVVRGFTCHCPICRRHTVGDASTGDYRIGDMLGSA